MIEDGAEFIDDFAVSAVLKGNAVSVIIDKSTFFDQGIEKLQPAAVGTYADLGAAVEGNVLIVNSRRYEVMGAPLNDGANTLTTLILRYA